VTTSSRSSARGLPPPISRHSGTASPPTTKGPMVALTVRRRRCAWMEGGVCNVNESRHLDSHRAARPFALSDVHTAPDHDPDHGATAAQHRVQTAPGTNAPRPMRRAARARQPPTELPQPWALLYQPRPLRQSSSNSLNSLSYALRALCCLPALGPLLSTGPRPRQAAMATSPGTRGSVPLLSTGPRPHQAAAPGRRSQAPARTG